MTEFRCLAVPDVLEITPRRYGDDRGWFMETFSAARFADHGIDHGWVQDNQSMSATRGTVRGLHFQRPPAAQAKLVRVVRGAIFDVAVDLRTGSTDFGRWVGVELTADRGNQLYVPIGFAHGFITLTDQCEVAYKVSAPYAPDQEGAVHWLDPTIGIDWPDVGVPANLSEKDQAALPLTALASPF